MRYILFTLFLLQLSYATAQEITYFNANRDTVTVDDNWTYLIQLRQEQPEDSIWIEEKISRSTQLLRKESFYYNDKNYPILHGRYQQWNNNGQLLKDIFYVNGKLDGLVKTYWSNGQLKRDDIYSRDSLIAGQCYNSSGKKIKHFPLNVQPQFKGGHSKMLKFITKNIKYPEEALDNGEEGVVVINFTVNRDGSLGDFLINKKVSPSLDKEALRIVTLMQGRWTPGYDDGETVRVKISTPFRFRLNATP